MRPCGPGVEPPFLQPMAAAAVKVPPPRVLLLIEDQWPRALLRAALLEAGYDAVGARSLGEALGYPANVPDRGPLRVVVVDQQVLRAEDATLLPQLLRREGEPVAVLLASATAVNPEGPWRLVLRRPLTIGDVVREIQSLAPLGCSASGSV